MGRCGDLVKEEVITEDVSIVDSPCMQVCFVFFKEKHLTRHEVDVQEILDY